MHFSCTNFLNANSLISLGAIVHLKVERSVIGLWDTCYVACRFSVEVQPKCHHCKFPMFHHCDFKLLLLIF